MSSLSRRGFLLSATALGGCTTYLSDPMPLRDQAWGAHVVMSGRWVRGGELASSSILNLSFERYDPATGNYFKTEKGHEAVVYGRRDETFAAAPAIHEPFYKLQPARPGLYRLSSVLLSPAYYSARGAVSGESYVTNYVGSHVRVQFPRAWRVKVADANDWKTVTFEVRENEVAHIGGLTMQAPNRTYPLKIVGVESDLQAARKLLADRPDLASRLVTRTMKLVPLT